MILRQIKDKITTVINGEIGGEVDLDQVDVSRTSDAKFGDLTTNAAMVVAKRLNTAPRTVAETLVVALKKNAVELKHVEVAGPGFINMTLADSVVARLAQDAPVHRPDTYKDQEIVAEYSDPSSFKVLHAGHFYTSVVGDAIANLLEIAGGNVHRVNFGGDVGLHVAKTMWSILKTLGGEFPDKLKDVPSDERADWLSAMYVEGNAAYEDNEEVRASMVDLNKRIYQLHEDEDHISSFAQIYWTCRRWSYDYFDQFYARIGSHFEKYYPESVTIPVGLKTVREQLAKGVYEESNGAIVFRGDRYGLHTRVFINSQGLPTYEAKDVGLIMMKWQDYHFDMSFILTDNAQEEYMAVVLKSIEQFAPNLANTTTHFTHGRVKLAGGQKMSSRKGNIVRAVDVLKVASEANRAVSGRDDDRVVLGAVKYAFLKHRIGTDITYVPEESVSLEGNSGPYLQYAHARARSILRKSRATQSYSLDGLSGSEIGLAQKVGEYPEVLQKAVDELMPHGICTYLYEIAQIFNRFYEGNRVIGDQREAIRLHLVSLYADVLKNGLTVLGIAAPDQL